MELTIKELACDSTRSGKGSVTTSRRSRKEITEDMYYLHNFYSKGAWDAWKNQGRVAAQHRVATSKVQGAAAWKPTVTFDPVNTFDELVERVAFLQLMNKRHVLYYRGENQRYDSHEPSIFRGASDLTELRRRWQRLKTQATHWRKLLDHRLHPRQATLDHYPQSIWAVQQHYKELLEKEGIDAAASPFFDVTHSLRVAAHFATSRNDTFTGSPQDDAYVFVIALPQTTGSVTFDADEQLQILRLSALCPPLALRPTLQEGYLVGRFPMPDPEAPEEARDWEEKYWSDRAEYFSPRRRTVAIIPIRAQNGSFMGFWGGRGFKDADLMTDAWFESAKEDLCRDIRKFSG